MKKKKIALNIFALALIVTSFIACDSDFNNLESDVLNSDVATNFNIKKLSELESNPEFSEVITYSQALGPVQTNNAIGLSTLGLYNDIYGRVTSSFVSQVTLSSYSPTFQGSADELAIDSVVLTMPYFYGVTDVDEDNNITYNVDSIFPDGDTYNPIKLHIYENNYFLRDFDPSAEFNDAQAYFSNKTASTSETISPLEGSELIFVENPSNVNHLSVNQFGNIKINNQGFKLTTTTEGDDGEENTSTINSPPGIRLKLDHDFWQEKIINKEGDAVLSNSNNFLEYFRGLYFKAEAVNDNGSYIILNTNSTSSNITIYYTTTTTTQDDNGEDVITEEQGSFALYFGGNKVNFFDNNFDISIPDSDATVGDERVYLKGGEGSIAKIKLFNGDNLNDGDDQTFDNWKNFFVETDADGNFKNIKKLVNEANLVFYVDQDYLNQFTADSPENEPDRLYIYDFKNQLPLTDFFVDATNGNLPYYSKYNHLSPLQREGDESTGEGIKYKFRITEHINNLLLNDSTNVELGLAVSLNVNLEELVQQKVQTTDGVELTTPISSVLSPRGTVLHGNNTADESKRVYLEIYYTCLEGDCEEEE
ncbi:MAG: hypothetical protein CMC05_00595 [Flavobacteriaceae bacterium]|nr:hypothetical protein [Flavobacteriaceae bacterium]MBD10819.1 hypothetical protein [Flavobacteriaceae bacterium]|tara:strand:- start:7162 stop:8937 length:1776 start_codon:yes stop_codon:yes gene_type:complete